MTRISVVIITLNEERNIARCINSVSEIADEVLVVDSNSTDKTTEIASSLGARVVKQSFLGHIEQKNFAKDQATNEWVLSLDADEALSPELKNSILAIKPNFNSDGYRMNRLTNYCGKWIRHSGWYPDTKLRLFRKDAGQWQGTNPHDRFDLHAGKRSEHLKGDLLHYSFYSVVEHEAQIEKFTNIAAQAKLNQGIKSNWFKILVKPVAKLLKSFILKRGFLDGYYGWVIARSSAYATYLKYYKLLKLQSDSK